MTEAYLELLRAFNFTEMQAWIAVISAFLFMSNLLGGILSAMFFASSSTLQPRPLKERISFRLFLMTEVILWVFVFFYHVFMIEDMILAHLVYWISATMIMPLLAIIGSQVMYVVFGGRMKAKEEALKSRERAVREQRRKAMDDAPAEPMAAKSPKSPKK